MKRSAPPRHREGLITVPPLYAPAPTLAAERVDIDALYRAHARTVARWALRLGGPAVDPEDVVQEVFLVAKRRLRTFVPGGQATTWLFRTTEKIVRGLRRRQRVRRMLLAPVEKLLFSETSPGPSALERIERDETVRAVYAILDRLPERLRRVLVLFELEGLSTQAIAELLGTRVTTVRVWLFRARARFAAIEAQRGAGLRGDHGEKERG